jgi:DNA polymerase II small subunit
MMEHIDLINYFLEKGILLSPDSLDFLSKNHEGLFFTSDNKPMVLSYDVLGRDGYSKSINWIEFEKALVDFQLQRNSYVYDTFISMISGEEKEVSSEIEEELDLEEEFKEVPKDDVKEEGKVIVVKTYKDFVKKREVRDFVSHFKVRFNALKEILLSRPELREAVSINRLPSRKIQDRVVLLGVISEIKRTKNGNVIITLEDTTGTIEVLFMKNKKDLFEEADELVLDETIGVIGNLGNKIVYGNEIYLPEVPLTNEMRKSPDETYAVFSGDFHIGIKQFTKKPFENFLSWLKGDYGSDEHKRIASLVRYLIIPGDIIEGLGIYPGQENDLSTHDIYDQYAEIAEYLREIPNHIKVVIIGGNHDAMRIAEPQPPLDPKYAAPIYELPNVICTSNPSVVNIHSSKDFSGFDLLLYHGFSFPYYADNIQRIRANGGVTRPDLIMEFLLRRRHLAPAHGSNLYIPDPEQDPLIIEKVPDFFISGHIHKVLISNYRGVSLVNASCWVEQTEDQEKRGIVPDPGKVPIVNLKTREFKIMNFGGSDASSE